jgi:uncharacterized protein (TIGR03437 family)
MDLTRFRPYFLLATVAVLLMVSGAIAQAPLGTASTYAVLAGSGVTNTGATIVTGNVGSSPTIAVGGFPPGVVAPPFTVTSTAASATAQTDLTTAYNDLVALPCTTNLTGQDLGSLAALTPGVYCFNSSAQLTGTLTLNGQNNPNASFTFQIGSTLTTASASQIILTNGAQPGNIFWQVGSSATLGTTTAFQGNIVSLTSITLNTGASVTGRALARNGAVTMGDNSITLPGSIQVVKNTVGGDGTFVFTDNIGLTSLTTAGNTATYTINSLTPGGAFNVSETVPTGWIQTSASCTNGTPAAVTVVAGATTTCTFTNTLLGAIKVVKNTIGGNGTFGFISNFGFTSLTTVGGTASQTITNLTPGGLFSVSETVPTGWTQTSAVCSSGTPGAVSVAPGVTTTCTFTNAALGSIQVVKNTIGGNGTFLFNSNFGVSSLTTTGNTASQTVNNLTPGGSFSISETVPAGWTQTSATCTSGTPASITVAAGTTTTCTFINTAALGSIQVVKNTVGGNGTFAFTSNFGVSSLTTTGNTASQTVNNLTPGGTFSISETVPAGWTQTSATCTSGTPASITVATGATTTCTFTNTALGSIQVVKNTIGGNGTFAFTSNFGVSSLTTAGNTASQTVNNLTPGGTFSISETVPAGWTQTSATCTSGTLASITVAAGATTTCTFTNTALGSIRLVKNTVGGNGTFAFISNFGVSSLTTAGNTASQTVNNLTPGGSFSVSETVASGWTQTGANCTNGTPGAITVTAGVTTTCTITNTVVAPPSTGSIQVVKMVAAASPDGTFAFTSNFGLITQMTTKNGSVSSPWVMNLTPGSSYSVSETLPTGWTQTSAVCSNGVPSAITVIAGATTICTFTNSFAAAPTTGSITVVKNTVGGNGTFAFTSNFGLTSLTTSSGTATQTFSNLAPGAAYSLGETVPSGWTQTSVSCTNGTPNAIIVTAAATTTCTITNTMVALVPDLGIAKSHVGNFSQGDVGDNYTLTVSNVGPGPTTGTVTASDILPAGLTATAISGTGWSCTLATLTCTRSDVLAAGASYPVITVTVNVANTPSAFPPAAGSPVFQSGDILISMTDGTVQWWREPWMEIEVLPSVTTGEAKGMAFDTSNNLYVTHWYATNLLSGNDVATFNQYGNSTALFGSGYNCNPSSIVFDNSGNAYVGQSDCSTAILKFGPSGNPLAQYSVQTENRGTYDIGLDNNQCTMYYTSEGPDVLRFNVCTNTQMSNFNSAALPDPVAGAFALLPGGGMLIANSSVITSLNASGNFVRTYGGFGGTCWLGMALDPDGVSFWASDWCASSVTRFNIATGNVIETHVVSPIGFMVKRIAIPKNIFTVIVTNTATVAGGGELNVSNDSASDPTTINPPAPLAAPATNPAGTVNAASYRPTVAAGSVASVFGTNLSVGTTAATTMPLPTALASATLQVGGQSAPLFYASPSQVNVQIPWALAGQSQAGVTATVGNMTSDEEPMNIAPFAPGIFTLNIAGSSQGAVMIANTAIFAAPQSVPGSRPVSPGQFISIYCTGLGAVSNQPATGAAAQGNPLSSTPTTPIVTIGGIASQVSFSGLAPGFVGLYQVNAQVPSGTPAGSAVPIILSIGGVTSNTVTIAVQ